VHRLAQAGRAADQRHNPEAADQSRQRRDVGVAAFGVNQGRAQDRPGHIAPFAGSCDFLLGIGEFFQLLPLGRNFTIQLGDDAGRTENHRSLQ
jgi:hypothetical protein